MYEYIKGLITELNPSYAVVESGGVGYFVHISLNTYSKLTIDTDCKLFIHQIVREDANLLFGFESKEEREIFRLLLTVSGVGANTARMMLSSLTAKEIADAIQTGNENTLKSIKGIGLKTAQRLIVELKDKIGKNIAADEILKPKYNTIKEESLSALIMLGFAKTPAEKTVDQILVEHKTATVEDVVKLALKRL